jgi:hypothetical protein
VKARVKGALGALPLSRRDNEKSLIAVGKTVFVAVHLQSLQELSKL